MDRNGAAPVVVIGASAGGIQALLQLVAELPPDFGSPILVVVHIGRGRSVLPRIIERGSALSASHAEHGEALKPGHVYVAPPDCHMVVRAGRIELNHGPRENHSRPAIDPLFRSAATAFGHRTIGIILSGALSDGSAGLMMIKARGGTVVVQDPEDATIEGMPESALRLVQTDHVLSARDIGKYLASLPAEGEAVGGRAPAMSEEANIEMIREDFREQEQDRRTGELTMFTCPDCGGTLWQSAAEAGTDFRCHVGHTWGAESLLGSKSEHLEAALWSSVRLLEERATLSRQLAARMRSTGIDEHRAVGVEEQGALDERRADAIRELLHTPMHMAIQLVVSPQFNEAD